MTTMSERDGDEAKWLEAAHDALGTRHTDRFQVVVDKYYRHHNFHSEKHRCLPDLVVRGQDPKDIFIGCSDSRTLLFMPDEPGEEFPIRTAGGLVVQPWQAGKDLSVWTTLEVGLSFPNVQNIVVQHHDTCGFQRLMMDGTPQKGSAAYELMKLFAEDKRHACQNYAHGSPEAREEMALRLMATTIRNLSSHPVIAQRVENGTLAVWGTRLRMGMEAHGDACCAPVFTAPGLELFMPDPRATHPWDMPGKFIPYVERPSRENLGLHLCPHFDEPKMR